VPRTPCEGEEENGRHRIWLLACCPNTLRRSFPKRVQLRTRKCTATLMHFAENPSFFRWGNGR
jgi:hypothetical protein